MYRLLTYYRRDNRERDAVIYEILSQCTVNDAELPYDDFIWIVNRINFYHADHYYYIIVPYDYLTVIDDLPLKASSFDRDWNVKYKLTREGRISYGKKRVRIVGYDTGLTHFDYISPCSLKTIHKIILRWKLYGKYIIRFQNFLCRLWSKFNANN